MAEKIVGEGETQGDEALTLVTEAGEGLGPTSSYSPNPEDDAKLDKILLGMDPGTEEEIAEDAAKAEAEAPKETKEQPAAEDGSATADTENKPETPSEVSADVIEAREELSREGIVPKEVIDSMTSEQVLVSGYKARERRRDRDRQFRFDGKANQAEPTREASGPQSAEAADYPSSEQDISRLVQPLAEALGLDADGAKVLTKFQQDLIAPIAQRAELASARATQAQLDAARSELGERFPEVREGSDSYEAVIRKMANMDNGDYSSIRDLMRDAAEIQSLPRIKAEAAAAKEEARIARAELKNQKSAGQLVTETRVETPEPRTDDDKMSEVLDMLESNEPDRRERARGISGY